MSRLRIGRRLHAIAIVGILVSGCSSAGSIEEIEPAPGPRALLSPALESTLAGVAATIEQRGFTATAEPMRAFLVEHDALVEPTSLPTGRCHVFVALGSPALQELSIGIFDSGGTEVATAQAGRKVALRYCPDRPGTHYVAVRALAGDGLVAARRFEGPSGIAIDLDDLFEGDQEAPERP